MFFLRAFMFSLLVCGCFVISAKPGIAEPFDTGSIQISNLSGKSGPLSDLLPDTPVILHFWATWCAPCREELPSLQAFQKRLEKQGLAGKLIVISADTRPLGQIEAFLKDDLGLADLETFQADSQKAASVFRLSGLPSTILIGPNGDELSRHVGSLDWFDPAVQDGLISLLTSSK